MRALAGYITQGRLQAALVAVVAAALSLIIAPLSYVSGAAVALYTLVFGAAAGLQVIGIATAVVLGVGLVAGGGGVVGLAYLVGVWAPVWVVAEVLRRTVSLSSALLVAGLLGGAVVALFHLLLADPGAWWQEQMGRILQQFQEQGAALDPAAMEVLGDMAFMFTGVIGAAMVLSLAATLFIARWWQAILYNPGGFQQAFHALRLDPRLVWVALLLFAGAVMTPAGAAPVALHLLMVVAALFLLQGLAVVHGGLGRLDLHAVWLVGFYFLLVLVPHVVLAMAALGFLDRWLDVRGRLPDRRASDDDTV